MHINIFDFWFNSASYTVRLCTDVVPNINRLSFLVNKEQFALLSIMNITL